MEYKLSTALFGHSMDVRALATTADGNIISASRDKTAKIWKPNGFNSGYTDVQTLKGHSNFVSSVCVLPATEAYPGGIVLTGSNDNTICVFSPDNPQPLFTLKGHNSAVCHLSPGINPGTFLSASWDFTCKIWSLSTPSEPQATLTGHQMAVWSCLQLLSSFIITASADKTIIVYTSDGKSHKTLSGHTDCVRDLTAVSETEFLSCSNDATIRKWNALTGECLDIMYGHPNYIYSIFALNNVIVSGGEDRIVKVWHGGKHQQLILPSQSIWAVAVLPNMDVVTGSSDGVVRIFSANPERYADETTLAQFNEEVSNLNAAAQQEIGGVKVSDLPGIEALYEPGKSDGQTKLIREGGGVVCYNWSAANQKWEKVGDVMGAGNENPQETAGGPQMYEGKPYDYVFSVDIEDGKPPLKLPYNDGEDPWHAAQNFIHRHNLSQQFLEQVANFIITNSRKPETSAPTGSTQQQQFCDPFTGGARYIPAGSDTTSINSNVTNGNVKPELQHPTAAEVKLFPQTSYLRFDHGNLKLILEKLEEFNKKSASGVDVDKLKSLIELADVSSQPSAEALTTLKQLLKWSPDILFPVLDVLRLAIRNSQVNASLCDGPSGEQMLQMLQQHLDPSALPANQMLATRALSNMLTHPTGESLLLKNRQFLLDTFSMLLNNSNTPNKQLQIALTTVLLNLSIVFINNNDKVSQESIIILLNKALPVCSDPEAQLRGLVTLGTLLVSSNNLINVVDPLVVDLLHQLAFQENSSNSNSNKVISCSKQILQLLKE